VKVSAARAALLIAFVFGCASSADASITARYGGVRYGDFDVTCTDIMTPSWLGNMTLQRVYVSSNDYTGMFGAKWETRLETNLDVQDDGSVVVHEFGGGYGTPFPPTNAKVRPLGTVYDEITAAAERAGRFGSDSEENAYRDWLKSDSLTRQDEWVRLRDLGLVTQQRSHAGETFYSGEFGSRFITRVPEGYQREDLGGRIEAFDLAGKLERVWDANRNFITLRYDSRGRLTQIDDNLGNKFVFFYNALGFVEKIAAGDGRVARFEYKGSDLVKSVDAAGVTLRYEYDEQHHMTAVRYAEGKSTEVTYNPYRVKELKNRDGSDVTYEYKTDDTHIDASSTTKAADGTQSQSEYHYSGPRWGRWDTYAVVTNGKRSETKFDAVGHATSYTTPDGVTRYRYDQLGRTILEEGPQATIATTYAGEATDSAATVTKTAGGTTWTRRFEYDPKGNLTRASDNQSHVVTFKHDEYGRLTMLVYGDSSLHVSYDRLFEPETVALDGVGQVRFTYAGDGGIKSVDGGTTPAAAGKIAALVRLLQPAIDPTNQIILSSSALAELDKVSQAK